MRYSHKTIHTGEEQKIEQDHSPTHTTIYVCRMYEGGEGEIETVNYIIINIVLMI